MSIASRSARGTCRILRSEEHTSELQSQSNLVCRLLLEKKKKNILSRSTLHLHLRLQPTPAPASPCPDPSVPYLNVKLACLSIQTSPIYIVSHTQHPTSH